MRTPIVMRPDGTISAMEPTDLKEVAKRDERIRALEKLNATLAAEVDRLNGEVDKWRRYAKDLEHDMKESEKHCAEYHG